MEEFLEQYLNHESSYLLLVVVAAVALVVLGKAADWLVEASVALSTRTRLPKVVVGATVVSLGTTMPEAAVSVMAAVDNQPGIALGNSVGSMICDAALILGLAAIIGPLPLDRKNVPRLAWILVGCAALLVGSCFPWTSPLTVFKDGGRLPQALGILFVVLLGAYLWLSVFWARSQSGGADEVENGESSGSTGALVIQIILALLLVCVSARVLIPAVVALAEKMGIPESIVSATLVAFGTSLPELVTAVTASLRGHGELAVGNVMGADILNVLFVAGAAAAVTPAGLEAGPHFFYFLFPVMLGALSVLIVGLVVGKTVLPRAFGYVLLGFYVVYLVVNTILFV